MKKAPVDIGRMVMIPAKHTIYGHNIGLWKVVAMKKGEDAFGYRGMLAYCVRPGATYDLNDLNRTTFQVNPAVLQVEMSESQKMGISTFQIVCALLGSTTAGLTAILLVLAGKYPFLRQGLNALCQQAGVSPGYTAAATIAIGAALTLWGMHWRKLYA